MANPLPPEHTSPPPIRYGNLSEEVESKHPVASFILPLTSRGTECHAPNNVEIFNGRYFSDHDTHRSTDNTTTTTTTPTNDFDDDDDDFFAFLDLQETPDSAVNAASSLTLERATQPRHKTSNPYDDTTTTTTHPTTTPTNDFDDDDDDFFAFLDCSETPDSAANDASRLTLDWMTPPHHTTSNSYDAKTTPTTNPTTTPRTDDDDDDDDFFAFMHLQDTFDSTANTTGNLTLEQTTPTHHATNNHYDSTTTTTTHPIDDDADDDDFFTFLTLPETVASEENDANTCTLNRATPPHPTIDDKDDATTTTPPTTKHADDIDTCTPKPMTPTPTTLLAPQDKSECLNMTFPEPAFPRTGPVTTNRSNPFDMPRPPDGPSQSTGPGIARRTVLPATTPESTELLKETMQPNPETYTIQANNKTHWIRDACTSLFQTADRWATATTTTATTMMMMTQSCPSTTQNPQTPIKLPPLCINLATLAASIRTLLPLNPSTRTNDDIPMMPNTTPTTMPITMPNKTKKTTLTTDNDEHTTTTSTHFTPYPPTQSSAANKADNAAHDADMYFSMMMRSPATVLPTPSVPSHDNSPITGLEIHYLKQRAASKAVATTAANHHSPRMTSTTTKPMTCPPPPLPSTRAPNTIPKPAMQPQVHSYHDLTTHWLCATLDPVFQAIDRPAAAIADLPNRILEAHLKTASTTDSKPQKLHPNQQSYYSQPHRHRPHKPNPFLHPQLSTCHPSHFYMTLPDHPGISVYRRYMAHDFLPP